MAIVRHDLPFQFVEYQGIRDALSYIDPGIKLVSRNTAIGKILKIYNEEKSFVKKLLHSVPGRISLTSDLWTSVSTDGYISLTAHFVDCDWVLQKRILNFSFMPTPHTGVALTEKFSKLLSEWVIEKKLFSLTLDNAFCNDVFVNLLRNQLNLKNALLCNGEFFHIRCCAHVLNLVVQDGLQVIDHSVTKIRESVKYLKGSQQRKQRFLNCVAQVSLDSKRGLRQDVPTQWNSTYQMLESACYYRRAFMHLELSDSNYKFCPTEGEWANIEKISKFLGVFYKVTCIFSGSQYPTSNLYFPHVFIVQDTLSKALSEGDNFIRTMAAEMHTKFHKYWSTYSLILAIAVVFDPRYKFQFVEWCYDRLYGKGSIQLKEVREKLFSLFFQYMQNIQEPTPSTSNPLGASHGMSRDVSLDSIMEDFDLFDAEESSNTIAKNQLELYLDEPKLDRKKELNVLHYWKGNQYRYPQLALMARDILAIPVSTVASEAAFSIGGRVVDKFRSALKPPTVEALICTQDWIFGKKDDIEPEMHELCEDVTDVKDGIGSVDEDEIDIGED